jgi:bifunctional non-homologous end joining protein LigD
MIIPKPLRLVPHVEPFDDPNWLYEIKHDGFRGLALIERGHCWFLSRRKHKFHRFRDLAASLAREVNADMAVLDGELAVPDQTGRTIFAAIMKHPRDVRYHAFDLLWLDGQDLRQFPLHVRKEKLKRILPSRSNHILYVDHTKGGGTNLYRLACQLDLEGIVAKKADSPYEDNERQPNWIKIKNSHYSQKAGRGELFKRAI